MRIHILGICGTFMGSLALLARSLGHEVSGSDAGVYPPMSTQLHQAGIELHDGYSASALDPAPDLVIIGNALSRGNPAVEYVLDQGIPYTSGPAWLAEHVLNKRHVIAVAGTHGKTTTTSLLAWVLDHAGFQPGFLIGGVPLGLKESARLGTGEVFVVEADEYDTAFFDKRSKFIHYHPNMLIINNIEFDHADIFADLAAIQTQFHYLIRTIPGKGIVFYPKDDKTVEEVLDRGLWSKSFSMGFNDSNSGADFVLVEPAHPEDHCRILHAGEEVVLSNLPLLGRHNRHNVLMCFMAARACGVPTAAIVQALQAFPGVKRRMELLGSPQGIHVYDDFAHHPTAIDTTLRGLREKIGDSGRIIAVIEPRSNTMKLGVHQQALAQSTEASDAAYWYIPPLIQWDIRPVIDNSKVPSFVLHDLDELIDTLVRTLRPGDHVVIMSNGGFGGLHQRLLEQLGYSKEQT